jgi:hypothetical protein
MINKKCTACYGEGTIHEGGFSIMSKHSPCDCVKVAIGHIVTLETLPHQIDYTKPYQIKANQAQQFINSLPKEEQEIANKEIIKQLDEYNDSGAAFYDSLF